MKLFKQIDLAISIMMITGFLVYIVITKNSNTIFTAYFVVGGWQVLSMIVHEIGGWFTRTGGTRRIYHWVSLTVIVMGCLTPVINAFFFIFYIMAFAAPLMAVIYTAICFNEVKFLKNKPAAIF